MSLSLAETLRSLALGQALIVTPALGEGYGGRTAATIAALLMLLADDVETMPDRLPRLRATILALLADATVDDPALAADIAAALAGDLPRRLDAVNIHLLGLFAAVHAWADAHDPALAARCRALLMDVTAMAVLSPPRLPADPPA